MLFDAHTHLKNINKPYKKIVCASNLQEWEILAKKTNNNVIPAYGIHPWYMENSNIIDLEKFIKNENCLLGECGLDKLHNYDNQEKIFIAQLDMAKKYNKIVIIHCVKAWDIMIKKLKNYQELSFIFHRFQGNISIIEQLPENSYFSLGLKSIDKYINFIPKDKILLETDDEDHDISEVYKSAMINEDIIYNNAKKLLGNLL